MVRLGHERLFVVGDEQLLRRLPHGLELAAFTEIRFAEQISRQPEHSPLSILVGRDRVENRRETVGRLAVERHRGRQEPGNLHVVECRGQPPHEADFFMRIVVGVHQLHDDVRIELAGGGREIVHDLGHPIGRHHRHDARQMVEGGEHDRRLRGDHRRTVKGVLRRHGGGRQITDIGRAAGDLEEPLLRAFVEHGSLTAGDRHDDRPPEVVSFGGLDHLAFAAREELCVVELLENQRRVAVGGPDFRRAAAAAELGGVERQQAQQRADAITRDVAKKREAHQVAVVK